MNRNNKNIKVIGKEIRQARTDHFLDTSELCSLVGLTEEQLDSLENERNYDSFVDLDHRVDCARRLSVFFGFQEDKFLSSVKKKSNLENLGDYSNNLQNRNIFDEMNNSSFFRKLLSINYFSPFKKKMIEKIINSYIKKIPFFELAIFSPSLLAPFVVFLFLLVFLFLKVLT